MNWLRSITTLFLCNLFLSFTHAQIYVACIGDSVTKGYGIDDENDSYPSQLQALLGDNYVIGNFGHSGATLLNNGHNPYIKTQAYQDALAFRPDIIIVALGLNDTDPRNWPNYKNEFIKDYTELIAAFREVNSKVEIYVCTMTPIFSGHRRFLSGTREWHSQIQDILPIIASENKARLLDNYAVLESRPDLFDDYLHPNAKGAKIIAQNVHRYLVPIQQSLCIDKTLGSHMVLQRNRLNTLKGKGTVGEKVIIEFNQQQYSTSVDTLGDWSVQIASQAAGGPYTIQVYTDDERIEFSDVWFGDVFLASGQSNMAFPVKSSKGADSLINRANYSNKIRLFRNKNLVATNNVSWDAATLEKVNDLEFFEGQWELASAQSIDDFSAVAYSCAKELAKAFKDEIPIGIIDMSVGGSNVESWMPRSSLMNDNLLASYIHSWRQSDFVQDFCRERANKNTALSTIKHQRHPYDPSYNYEAGIKHWTHVQLAGILWYQGESNTHNIEHHDYMFPRFVQSWRDSFNQHLPFYFVQLSSLNRPSWPYFREAQQKLSRELDAVYMSPSYDIGDSLDVHPTEKYSIGKRLANLVLKHQHHYHIQADSPFPLEISLLDNNIEVLLSNATQLKSVGTDRILELEAELASGHIVTINHAAIKGNKIIIPKNLQKVRRIRYAYRPYSRGNLTNEAGVPVSTFSINIL